MVTPVVARNLIRSIQSNFLVLVDAEIIDRAMDLTITQSLNYWDSLMLAAAHSAQCRYLLTEDMQHGQVIGGVEIRNPFA